MWNHSFFNNKFHHAFLLNVCMQEFPRPLSQIKDNVDDGKNVLIIKEQVLDFIKMLWLKWATEEWLIFCIEMAQKLANNFFTVKKGQFSLVLLALSHMPLPQKNNNFMATRLSSSISTAKDKQITCSSWPILHFCLGSDLSYRQWHCFCSHTLIHNSHFLWWFLKDGFLNV